MRPDYHTGGNIGGVSSRYEIGSGVACIRFIVYQADVFLEWGSSTVVALQDETSAQLVAGTAEWINVPTDATHYAIISVDDPAVVHVETRTAPVVEYGT